MALTWSAMTRRRLSVFASPTRSSLPRTTCFTLGCPPFVGRFAAHRAVVLEYHGPADRTVRRRLGGQDFVRRGGDRGDRRPAVLAVAAAVVQSMQPGLHLGDGRIERGIEVLRAGLGADSRATAGDGDLHPLARFVLAAVGLVGKFDVDSDDLGVVPLGPGQLLGDVNPEMLRNFHVPALDDDVHDSSCLAGTRGFLPGTHTTATPTDVLPRTTSTVHRGVTRDTLKPTGEHWLRKAQSA